jgi:tetratricopeptide (TPR) repeat protein
LSDKRFERVLYLHMAALAAVEGLEFEGHDLMEVILDHEENFWNAGVWHFEARQIIAAATLRGGLATQEVARGVAQRVLGRPASDESEKLLKRLHQLYRRGGEEPWMFLPALEPDLLGEGLVLRLAERALLKKEELPDTWIHRLLPADEEPGPVKNALEVLGRASARAPEVAREWLREILKGPLRPRAYLALQAAMAVGKHTALAEVGDELAARLEAAGDVELARELEAAGIPYPTVSLRRVAEWTTRTLLEGLPATDEPDVLTERARLLNNLGGRLSELGRREEALKATEQAVELRRALAKRNPEAFQPALAMSLNNLGNRLSELGRREEALKATEQAVETYGALAQRNPEAFQPALAMSLNNLGNRLSELGRREEALNVYEEAVSKLQPFLERNPGAFGQRMAMLLKNVLKLCEALQRPLPPAVQESVAHFVRLMKH